MPIVFDELSVEAPAAPPAVAEPAPLPEPVEVETAPPGPEEAPAPVPESSQAAAAPDAAVSYEPPPSIALARLYLQQQAPDEAVRVLEKLLEADPDNIEASDFLALVRDMMMPLPEAPPPLSARERKIAALQRWLASLTLGSERPSR